MATESVDLGPVVGPPGKFDPDAFTQFNKGIGIKSHLDTVKYNVPGFMICFDGDDSIYFSTSYLELEQDDLLQVLDQPTGTGTGSVFGVANLDSDMYTVVLYNNFIDLASFFSDYLDVGDIYGLQFATAAGWSDVVLRTGEAASGWTGPSGNLADISYVYPMATDALTTVGQPIPTSPVIAFKMCAFQLEDQYAAYFFTDEYYNTNNVSFESRPQLITSIDSRAGQQYEDGSFENMEYVYGTPMDVIAINIMSTADEAIPAGTPLSTELLAEYRTLYTQVEEPVGNTDAFFGIAFDQSFTSDGPINASDVKHGIIFPADGSMPMLKGIDTGVPGSYYAKCTSSSSLASKIAVCPEFTSLSIGSSVTVYFSYYNTSTVPALNVNNTGAFPIRCLNSVNFSYVAPTVSNGLSWGLHTTSNGGYATFVFTGEYWLYVDASTKALALSRSAYGVCSSTAATITKSCTCESFTQLKPGACITVYFTYNNTATSPQLNVNGTGAKYIMCRINGSSTLVAPTVANGLSWDTYSYATFVFDGTYWIYTDATLRAYANKLLASNTSDIVRGYHIGTCPGQGTGSNVSVLTVSCSTLTKLVDGVCVAVAFTNSLKDIGAFFVNVNNTGSYPLHTMAGANFPGDAPLSWTPGSIVTLMFANDTWFILNYIKPDECVEFLSKSGYSNFGYDTNYLAEYDSMKNQLTVCTPPIAICTNVTLHLCAPNWTFSPIIIPSCDSEQHSYAGIAIKGDWSYPFTYKRDPIDTGSGTTNIVITFPGGAEFSNTELAGMYFDGMDTRAITNYEWYA